MHQPEEVEESWQTLIETAASARMTVREFEMLARRRYVELLLAEHRGNQCKAARSLGMHRNTLGRAVNQLGIDLVSLGRRRKRRVTR
jgi:Fis family transcriptional regulator, factor for inversion stimulation protein